MEGKKCFKCGEIKTLDAFYKHPMMADGHLNKCKDCNKSDSLRDYKKKINDPEWKESERKRGRIKYHAYKYSGNSDSDRTKKSREKYPEKYKAHKLSAKIPLDFEGAQRHHWSYNEEHLTDVIQLTNKAHAKAHRFLIYDQERMMYRTTDGILLDTKERHFQYISEMIRTKED